MTKNITDNNDKSITGPVKSGCSSYRVKSFLQKTVLFLHRLGDTHVTVREFLDSSIGVEVDPTGKNHIMLSTMMKMFNIDLCRIWIWIVTSIQF